MMSQGTSLVAAVAFLLLGAVRIPALPSRPEEKPPSAARKTGLAVAPVVYYTPETRLAFGAGGLAYFSLTRDESVSRPSNIAFSAIYTQNKQYTFDLNPDFYLRHGYHVQFDLQYAKYPDKFFGIGNETPESQEEPYTSNYWKLRVEALKKTRGALNLGIQYYFDSVTLTEVQSGGELDSGTVPGCDGGLVSGGGLFLTHDSRDGIFFPMSGSFHQLSVLGFGRALGSDFTFGRFCLDARRYLKVRPAQVLALQSYFLIQTGEPPFWRMGMLGGEDGLRGYYLGRYRDRNMIYFQAEYRWVPVVWRIGLAAFAGLGEVAGSLDGFTAGGLRYSYGLGLRFVFSRAQRLNLRVDYAFGNGSSALYFTAAEAF
jgi:outer membrane protein assembly factor BamA